MLQVGDKVYAWDDISERVERHTIREQRRIVDSVDVIGTVRSIDADGFVEIELVTFPDTVVCEDGDFVFLVGTGPVLTLKDEDEVE